MRFIYRIARYTCQTFLAYYCRGRVFDLQNVPLDGAVMLACNHQSFLDPPMATCVLPRECHYLARDTLFRNPLFGRLISAMNAFPVKRGEADIGAVKETLRRLKAGNVVTVFPEGTRTIDGTIGPINPNSISIARKANATIVPTLVDGAFEAYPRTAKLPHFGRIYISYGKPITPEQIRECSNEEVAERVSAALQDMMRRSQPMRRRAASFGYESL